jgi:hypothetical protein
MRQYALYKRAEGEESKAEGSNKKEADRQAMMQALLALGGGGTGYLFTRYGLGLKGAGAGLTGAGLGAVAGAGAGALINRMASTENKKKEKYDEATKKYEKLVNRGYGETLMDANTSLLHNALVVPPVVYAAGKYGTRNLDNVKDAYRQSRLANAAKVGDQVAQATDHKDKVKIIRKALPKGTLQDANKLDEMIDAMYPLKGLTPNSLAYKMMEDRRKVARGIVGSSEVGALKNWKFRGARLAKATGFGAVGYGLLRLLTALGEKVYYNQMGDAITGKSK